MKRPGYRQVNFDIEEELYKKFKIMAAEDGLSVVELYRKAMKDFLNGWISIKEQGPPKKDKLYLIFVETADEKKPYLNTAWYSPDGFGWSLLPTHFIPAITHYRELPKWPQKREQE